MKTPVAAFWNAEVKREDRADRLAGNAAVTSGIRLVKMLRQGRLRKRWEDNSREWAGLEFVGRQHQGMDRPGVRGKTTSENGQAWSSWEDNIREWTVPEFDKSQRAVENRQKWRKLVVKSPVVPQRPSRLRDR